MDPPRVMSATVLSPLPTFRLASQLPTTYQCDSKDGGGRWSTLWHLRGSTACRQWAGTSDHLARSAPGPPSAAPPPDSRRGILSGVFPLYIKGGERGGLPPIPSGGIDMTLLARSGL